MNIFNKVAMQGLKKNRTRTIVTIIGVILSAAMITAGESEIVKMVAINKRGNILPPCGRCREFISQLNDQNIHADVLINRKRSLKLIDLLPFDWRQSKMTEVE